MSVRVPDGMRTYEAFAALYTHEAFAALYNGALYPDEDGYQITTDQEAMEMYDRLPVRHWADSIDGRFMKVNFSPLEFGPSRDLEIERYDRFYGKGKAKAALDNFIPFPREIRRAPVALGRATPLPVAPVPQPIEASGRDYVQLGAIIGLFAMAYIFFSDQIKNLL